VDQSGFGNGRAFVTEEKRLRERFYAKTGIEIHGVPVYER
jgi:hypothetical protein